MLALNRHQHILASLLGNENLVIIADPSNPSNMTSHEELLEEYRRVFDRVDERLLLSCFGNTGQGGIKIKEWQPPSTIDLLKEMKSSGTLSDLLSELVNYLINKKGNEDLGSVSDASIINPCNDVISICVVAHESKDPIRPSQAKIIDLNPSSENIEAVPSAFILGEQQLKDLYLVHDQLSSNR